MRQLLCAIGVSLFAVAGAEAQVPADPIPANPLSYSRTSAFDYYGPADGAKNGLLKSETIEPGLPQACVTTTYLYDANGNKTESKTESCAGATGYAPVTARRTSADFVSPPGGASVTTGAGRSGSATTVQVAQAAGLLAHTTTNELGHVDTRRYDPRFGTATTVIDANGLQSRLTLDDFGRVIEAIAPDGTRIRTWYCVVGSGLDTGTNTVHGTKGGCPSSLGAEVPTAAAAMVQTITYDAADAQMGSPTRVYTDRLGREIRVATHSFDGANQPGSYRDAIVVKDTIYSVFGAKQVVTQPYFLATRSSTTTGSSDAGGMRTEYDALGRPIFTYIADPNGSVAGIDFGVTVSRAARQRVVYNGLETETYNDKEQRRKETRSVHGHVVLIEDAAGARLAHKHDAFGNLIETRDALQNRILTTFDVRGRKVQVVDPDAGTVTFAYNAVGELRFQQNAKHKLLGASVGVTMTYDDGGRLRQRQEPEYVSNWAYDTYADGTACGKGRLCEATTSQGYRRRISYDGLGRATSTATTFLNGGPQLSSSASYHPVSGRVATQTYPSGLQVGYEYTPANGSLDRLTLLTPASVQPLPAAGGPAAPTTTLAAGTVLWRAQTVNAWGGAEVQLLGNGVNSRAVRQAASGRISALTAGPGLSNAVQNQSFTWDGLGNLTGRTDHIGDGLTGAVSESFTHGDAQNRLTSYTVSAQNIAGGARTVALQYNALGMLLFRSDVGVYSYPAQGGARPHAVQWVATTSGRVNFAFDENGNLKSADGGKYRSTSHNTFNLPDSTQGVQGPSGAPKYTWQYDDAHARIYEERVTAAGVRKTWYLHPDNRGGLGFEREEAGGQTSLRHYLSVGGQSIGVLVSTGNVASGQVTLAKVEYWHKDHLGSLVATTDHQGTVTARYAYDPFGKRRTSSGQYDEFGTLVVDWVSTSNAGTDRGFTGHEHLDDIGLVHMNGRIFDPTLGIFLQADPFIQSPDDLQNYNRYGYCLNSPLTCTDPTGYFSWKMFRAYLAGFHVPDPAIRSYSAYKMTRMVANTEWGYTIGSIAIGIVSGIYCNAWAAACNAAGQAAWASFAGYSLGDSLKIGVIAGVTTYIYGQIGDAAQNYGWGDVTKVAAHAVAGCATAEASGGNCGSGALAGAFGKIATLAGPSFVQSPQGWDQFLGAVVYQAVVGGTASVLGGGKFGNGAVTGAFAYLFNCGMHPGTCKSGQFSGDPNGHEVESISTICHTSDPNCTRQAVFERGLVHCPIPAACFDSPVQSGQVASIPTPFYGVNKVQFVVDPENFGVFNITVPGQHMWDPGYVYRNVQLSSAGYVTIVSYGAGNGSGRLANMAFYNARLWNVYDGRIVRKFIPNYPSGK